MTKILFIDIDGPLIPGRAHNMLNQTRPIVMNFDPCAVGIINYWCDKRKWKIVIHSSWIRIWGGEQTKNHCVKQGISSYHFHDDYACDEEENFRYARVAKWLKAHEDVTHYLILDDEPYYNHPDYDYPKDMEKHLVLVNFEDGILSKTLDIMGGKDFRVQD